LGVLTRALTVTINTPPALIAVTLSPTQPQEYEPLELKCSYADVDPDPLTLQIRWYRGDVHQPDYDNKRVLPASATSPGERWFATASVHDGLEYSPVMTSNSVEIAKGTATPRIRFYIYLPIVLQKYSTSTVTGHEYGEENDFQERAYPLEFDQIYSFYPDDVDDWYTVFLTPTASLHVRVTDYLPEETDRQGQLIVYKDCPACDPPRTYLLHDARGLSTMELPYAGDPEALKDLPPGWYYIRVHNPRDTDDTLYYLTVTYQP
jgi:hypothetical protein